MKRRMVARGVAVVGAGRLLKAKARLHDGARSLGVVAGCGLVALLALILVLRGRTWAWVPLVLAGSVGVREIRYRHRSR